MTPTFFIFTILLAIISIAMILIILVQRPQGGGLAGAFGGAGGGGTESVFGGRVGDALTWATVVAFVAYLSVAITLNKIDSAPTTPVADATETELPPPTVTRIDPPAGFAPGSEDLRLELNGASDDLEVTPLDQPPPGIDIEELLRPSDGSQTGEPQQQESDQGSLE